MQEILMENPEILDLFFKKHPNVFANAQQRLIEHFSESVSDNLLTHTNETLRNSPDLWINMEKNPMHPRGKKIIAFLDPLCPHSALLFKDLMQLASASNQRFSFCPHWVAHHQDEKSMLAARALLAAYALGKISAYMDLWINRIQNLSEKDIPAITSQLGINKDLFKKHMFSTETNQCIQNSRQYRNQFHFQGFPTLLYKKNEKNTANDQEAPFLIIEGRPCDPQELAPLLSD
jgi:hypothetical protein